MKIKQLVFRELFQRNSQLISSLAAVSLGIAVMVAIQSTTHYSEKAVAGELDALGANILLLAKDATVQDYYSADFQQSEIPESYVSVLTSSGIKGLDNLSPKYSLPIDIGTRKATLTGILPRNEFKSKATWQRTLGVFAHGEGCGVTANIPGITDSSKRSCANALSRISLPMQCLSGPTSPHRIRSRKVIHSPYWVTGLLPKPYFR